MPQYNPSQDQYIQELIQIEFDQIHQHLGQHLGHEIGLLQKGLNNLAGLDLAQLTALQVQVQGLYNALDGTPGQPGLQNLQELMDLLGRVAALETTQTAQAADLININDGLENLDDRITAIETTQTQAIADLAADISTAQTTANGAQAAATAAMAAVDALDVRENSNNANHGNAIGKLRQQVFLGHVGLAAVAIAGFNGAFATSKAAALL